jgi:hypothetical protein
MVGILPNHEEGQKKPNKFSRRCPNQYQTHFHKNPLEGRNIGEFLCISKACIRNI